MKKGINPFFPQENPLKTILKNNRKVGFFLQQNTLKWEMRRKSKGMSVVMSLSTTQETSFRFLNEGNP